MRRRRGEGGRGEGGKVERREGERKERERLDIYKRFGKSIEFKRYLHGVCDAGSRLYLSSGRVRMV